MELIIETNDQQLATDLLKGTLPDGVRIESQNLLRRRTGISPEIITCVISIGASVATNIFSTWLYEQLRERATTLYINRRNTQIEHGEIAKAVEESIQQEE